MGKLFFWFLFFSITVYGVIPGFFVRLFGFRAFQRGKTDKQLALTFDDGPHEIYTPRLLDLLQAYGIKATFFIVGKHAEAHPDVIARMHREGHLIGIHNYVHKTNWLMTPMEVKRQIEKSADIVERITGERPVYYRPPWGIVNLFDIFTLGNFRLILWSIIVGDWRRWNKRNRIKTKLLRKLNSGDVILLHDNGETFGAYEKAPEEMLSALHEFIDEVLPQGYRFVRVDEMIREADASAGSGSTGARGRVRRSDSSKPQPDRRTRSGFTASLWMGWEHLFNKLYRTDLVPNTRIFHVRLRKYSGRPLELQEGRRLQVGDQVLELHFDNDVLFEIGHESKSLIHMAIRLIHAVERAMPQLARIVKEREKYRGVKGLYGITMVNRGSDRLGFTIMDMQNNLFGRMTRWYLRLLMSAIHPDGKGQLKKHADMMVPKIVAMSTEELLRRYGDDRLSTDAAASSEEIAAAKANPQMILGK